MDFSALIRRRSVMSIKIVVADHLASLEVLTTLSSLGVDVGSARTGNSNEGAIRRLTIASIDDTRLPKLAKTRALMVVQCFCLTIRWYQKRIEYSIQIKLPIEFTFKI